jgi:hypothetical protein
MTTSGCCVQRLHDRAAKMHQPVRELQTTANERNAHWHPCLQATWQFYSLTESKAPTPLGNGTLNIPNIAPEAMSWHGCCSTSSCLAQHWLNPSGNGATGEALLLQLLIIFLPAAPGTNSHSSINRCPRLLQCWYLPFQAPARTHHCRCQ